MSLNFGKPIIHPSLSIKRSCLNACWKKYHSSALDFWKKKFCMFLLTYQLIPVLVSLALVKTLNVLFMCPTFDNITVHILLTFEKPLFVCLLLKKIRFAPFGLKKKILIYVYPIVEKYCRCISSFWKSHLHVFDLSVPKELCLCFSTLKKNQVHMLLNRKMLFTCIWLWKIWKKVPLICI